MKYKQAGKGRIYWTTALIGSAVGAVFSAIAIIPNMSNPNFTPRIMLLNFSMFTICGAAASSLALKVYGEEALHNASIDEIKLNLAQLPPDQLRRELQELTHEIDTMARNTGLAVNPTQYPSMDVQYQHQIPQAQGGNGHGELRSVPQATAVSPVQPHNDNWLNLPD